MNKILLIDKPKDWTSFDVVAKVRNAARAITGNKKIKVGHAGTLDPFATGLLIVLMGKENTAKQDSFMKQDKEYIATLKLGYTSTTGDPEGEISLYLNPKDTAASQTLRNDDIEVVLNKFTGEITQIPPKYSAIKIDGKRAYEYARKGEEVEIKPRNVVIHNIKVIKYDYPELVLCVSCSSGTYIRSLAEDIGKALGAGAYLTDLRRTKIGEYSVDDALSVSEALELLKN